MWLSFLYHWLQLIKKAESGRKGESVIKDTPGDVHLRRTFSAARGTYDLNTGAL